MAFFRNRDINLLNLHYGLHAVAISGGGAFFSVYLLKAGVSVPAVLVSLAAILAGRFLVRPLLVAFGVRYGQRRLLLAGTMLGAMQYVLLAEVEGIGPALFALIAVTSLGDMVYWTTYHAYFAALGDDEHRGHQLGAREAIGAAVSVLSPLLAGGLLVALGPRIAFGLTALVAMVSAVPLLWAPDVPVCANAPGVARAARRSVLIFMCDGWIAAGYAFVWQIALFQTLGESFVAYGGTLAIAALAGAVAGLALGRHIDSGNGRRAVAVSLGALAIIVGLRALAAGGNPALAVRASAAGSLGICLYVPVLMTAVYTEAKRSPCTLRFHVATEGGWDIGGASGALAGALLAWLGAPLWTGIVIALIGVAANYVLLYRYFAARQCEAGMPAP